MDRTRNQTSGYTMAKHGGGFGGGGTCMKHQKSKKKRRSLDFLSSSTTKLFLNVSSSFNRDIAGHAVAVTGRPGHG